MRHADGQTSTPPPPAPPGVSDAPLTLDSAPSILTIFELAHLTRVGVSTIRRQLAEGKYRPLPIGVRPYRWRKEDVEADIHRLAMAAPQLNEQRIRRRRARRRAQRHNGGSK